MHTHTHTHARTHAHTRTHTHTHKSEIADACEGSSSQELNLKENVPSFHFASEETHSELRSFFKLEDI